MSFSSYDVRYLSLTSGGETNEDQSSKFTVDRVFCVFACFGAKFRNGQRPNLSSNSTRIRQSPKRRSSFLFGWTVGRFQWQYENRGNLDSG